MTRAFHGPCAHCGTSFVSRGRSALLCPACGDAAAAARRADYEENNLFARARRDIREGEFNEAQTATLCRVIDFLEEALK